VFAQLETPVDFEASDDQPVDIVFLSSAPENAGADHSKALSRIARMSRDPERIAKLRTAHDATLIYELSTAQPASNAA
ncbi:hypothetical protein OY671_012639, partial [Metschnikowia pulcherrima]